MAIAGYCNLRPPGLPPHPHPPAHPSGKLSCQKTALGPVKVCVKFQPSSSSSFRDTRGVPNCTRGRCTPRTPPSGKKFRTQNEYLVPSKCVLNIKFLALVVSEIRGGPKFALGGAAPPARPLGVEISMPCKSTWACVYVCKISAFYL